MTWARFIVGMVKVAFNGSRNTSVRNVIVEFGEHGSFSIIRIPETELNTVPRYHDWAVKHDVFGKEVLDALWLFCRREYGW
jgi:hypothetical protein